MRVTNPDVMPLANPSAHAASRKLLAERARLSAAQQSATSPTAGAKTVLRPNFPATQLSGRKHGSSTTVASIMVRRVESNGSPSFCPIIGTATARKPRPAATRAAGAPAAK